MARIIPQRGNAVVLRCSRPPAFPTVCLRAGTGPVAPEESEAAMAGKGVISLTTGREDPEQVTVAFLVAAGAAEAGRPTLMFQAKEAVRLALDGVATGVACAGCPHCPTSCSATSRPTAGTWCALSASTPSNSTRAACCPTPNWP